MKARQNGFVMIYVIVILALIAIYMIILAGESNTFIFQADRAYLEACRENLTASGLIWAKQNVNTPGGLISLDTTDMNIKKAALSIAVSSGQKKTSQVEVNTSCSRGRQRLNSTRKFTIETR
jgi:hypothetical protein